MPRPSDEIGAHMSIAGGLHLALTRGAALGCSAVQIFVKNQRQWAARPMTGGEVRDFARERRRTGIRIVFAHGSYLVNLAAPASVAWAQAVDAFTDEVERAEALGLSSVVIHPGSHMGEGLEAGLARVVRALDEVVSRTAGYRVKIALENTAGAGNVLGRRFVELGAMLARARHPERLGVCIDTCHLFAAGYDIRTREGYESVIAECAHAVGLRHILAFHLNDAAAGLGSGLDRHAGIGEGGLGLQAFRFLLNDERFARIPKVLETPKDPVPRADLKNLATLRRLRCRRARSRRRARRYAGGVSADGGRPATPKR